MIEPLAAGHVGNKPAVVVVLVAVEFQLSPGSAEEQVWAWNKQRYLDTAAAGWQLTAVAGIAAAVVVVVETER